MAPSKAMPDWPSTYITAFRMPEQSQLDRTLIQRFPNLTVVDVSATLNQIQRVLAQVITAVEFLFIFTLVAGLIVLMAGLMTSRERRAREWAILRSLGATQDLLARVQRIELLGGGLGRRLVGRRRPGHRGRAGRQGVRLRRQAPLWWPLLGAVSGALLAWLAGWVELCAARRSAPWAHPAASRMTMGQGRGDVLWPPAPPAAVPGM